ncbi:sensor histidine kinase [Streptosporangium sp. DT93]|uniref:sensor histidine kinase n=1 Tax=Streptosporangium sp. DT93 TaxID=3393428 RepID=UPI003CF97886
MRATPRPADLLLPLVAGVFQGVGTYAAQRWQIHAPDLLRTPLDPLGLALLLTGPLALVVRRRHPVFSMIVAVDSTMIFVALGYSYGPVFLSPVIAFHHAAAAGHRRVAWPVWALAYAFIVVYTVGFAPVPSRDWFHTLTVAALMGLVAAVAEFSRTRGERRAERARTEEEELRRQASEERLTMAQELHDVLAHNISLIHVQASTALHLIDEHPGQARTALTTIKQASKDVLTEMRSVLSVLRDDAPRSPTAGLGLLDDLIGRTGLPVEREVTGQVRPLPPEVDRAGYRIAQEALTNVTRHAPGASVGLVLDYGPRALTVRVTDSGRKDREGGEGREGGEAPGENLGGGNGIPGMRERASALGGTLTATRHGRGFRVEARLPIPEAPRPTPETPRRPPETPRPLPDHPLPDHPLPDHPLPDHPLPEAPRSTPETSRPLPETP